MTSVDISMNDIDYESLFGGFETLSNTTVAIDYLLVHEISISFP